MDDISYFTRCNIVLICDPTRRKPNSILIFYLSNLDFKNSLQCWDANQCDQIGWFIGLWANFQSLWQQLISQISHIMGNFCKGVKIFIFSREIIFGQLFIDIWWLLTGHTAVDSLLLPEFDERAGLAFFHLIGLCDSESWLPREQYYKLVFS